MFGKGKVIETPVYVGNAKTNFFPQRYSNIFLQYNRNAKNVLSIEISVRLI